MPKIPKPVGRLIGRRKRENKRNKEKATRLEPEARILRQRSLDSGKTFSNTRKLADFLKALDIERSSLSAQILAEAGKKSPDPKKIGELQERRMEMR